MRAVVLMCLLSTAFGKSNYIYTWPSNEPDKPYDCLLDQSSCGCCLMQKQLHGMETFYNEMFEKMHKCLSKPKMYLMNIRASRSVFSVALNTSSTPCLNSTTMDMTIRYNHVLLNLGDGYNVETGVFTAPLSGVYSLSVTINSGNASMNVCAQLKVNDQTVAKLTENKEQSSDDSSTMVAAVKLKAGDTVWVNLPTGCAICEVQSHFNTFTGFLVYPADMESIE